MRDRSNCSKHTIYSKYAEERYVTIVNEETIIIKGHDLYLYTEGFGNTIRNNLKSVTFTGGPELHVNKTIKLKNKSFRIKSIFQKTDVPLEWKSFLIKGQFVN